MKYFVKKKKKEKEKENSLYICICIYFLKINIVKILSCISYEKNNGHRIVVPLIYLQIHF